MSCRDRTTRCRPASTGAPSCAESPSRHSAVAGGGLLSSCGTPGAIIAAGFVREPRQVRDREDAPVRQLAAVHRPVDKQAALDARQVRGGRPASRSPTSPTSTTTRASSPRSPTSWRGARRPDKDMFVLTDWMAGKMISLGWLQKLDHSKMPNVTKNMLPSLRAPLWDPHRDYSVPVAERDDRNLLQLRADRPGAQLRGPAHPARSQGQDRPAHRDARHDAVHVADRRGRPGQLHVPGVREGHRAAAEGRQRRTGTTFHRQRLPGRPEVGQRGGVRVVEWRHPAAGRPEVQVDRSRRGLRRVERQHAGAEPVDRTRPTPRP